MSRSQITTTVSERIRDQLPHISMGIATSFFAAADATIDTFSTLILTKSLKKPRSEAPIVSFHGLEGKAGRKRTANHSSLLDHE